MSKRSPKSTPTSSPALQTILVVDDDKAVCDLTASMLEIKGYRVFRAASGEEAIRLFSQYANAIQLLVVDIVMPRMSGHQLAQKLRNVRPTLPVLFMSGLVPYANSQEVLGRWFLRKPYTAQALAEKVRQVMAEAAA